MSGTNEAPKLGEKRGLDLGWLAGSHIQPAKRKEIEGVSASTIMDLQAQLYQAQESARARKEGSLEAEPAARRRGGLEVKGALGPRNPGVDARNAQDLTHKTRDRISEAYAALERKAALYEKLAQGQVDDDDEKYEVDFLAKGSWSAQGPVHQGREDRPQQHDRQQEQEWHERQTGSHAGNSSWPTGDGRQADKQQGDGHDKDEDNDYDCPRQSSQPQHTNEERAESERRQQHKEVVMQLAQQTKQQRERAAEVKRLKEQQAQSKVDKLKEDFLRKQMTKARKAISVVRKDAH